MNAHFNRVLNKMEKFWIFILVLFFATNLFEKAKSVELEETPHKIFEEIFGEGWWDKGKAEEWRKLTLEHNFHHEIDGHNTQIGQIEPNSTDQNPPLTESGPSDNATNGEEQNELSSNENIAEDDRKRKIIGKFHAIREEFKQKGKYSAKEWTQIDNRIAKDLKVSRSKIYEWKKEFGISQKVLYEKEKRKNLIEKFDQKKAELRRDGFKNSYQNEIDETIAKELGITNRTISNWKREFGQTKPKKYSHSEQNELMKHYYEIKGKNSKIRDEDIAKILKIGRRTLCTWKKQQFNQNSVESHSVEENAAVVREIENSNSRSI